MSTRETKTITVDSHTFEVKTYATAREVKAIQSSYFKGAKVEIIGEQPKISEFNPAVQGEVEKAMIAEMVVTFDGTTDNIVERCLDLPNEVYTELVAELDALVSKKKS